MSKLTPASLEAPEGQEKPCSTAEGCQMQDGDQDHSLLVQGHALPDISEWGQNSMEGQSFRHTAVPRHSLPP